MFWNKESIDRIVRETILWDLIELIDIIENAEDMNAERERMHSAAKELEYLLIEEY